MHCVLLKRAESPDMRRRKAAAHVAQFSPVRPSGAGERCQQEHIRQHEADNDQCEQAAGITLGKTQFGCYCSQP